MVNGLRNNKRHSSVFRTTARFISIVAIMVLGGQVLSAQEKGFLSIFEDNQGMSMKPNDIVETPNGEFLIIANEDGGTKSKVLKIDAEGILTDEIAIGAQDTVLKLNNLFLIQDDIPNNVHYLAVGTCSPAGGGHDAIITIWFDADLNVLHRVIEPVSFTNLTLYATRFVDINGSIVASLMFSGNDGKKVFLIRLSEEGEIVRHEECATDSLLFVANLFPIHGEQERIGMLALTSASSQARSGVLVFDSLLSLERNVFFHPWESVENEHVLQSYINADECMMAPLSDGNYVLSSKLWEKEMLPNWTLIREDRSVILAKVDENFEMLHDSIIIKHFNDSIEIPAPFRSVVATEDDFLYQSSNGNVVYPNSLFRGGLHLIITKTDMDLNVVWQKRYLRDGSAYGAFTSLATADGGLIVTGTRYNFNVDQRLDIFVLKIKADGTVGAEEDSIMKETEVYPNPGTSTLNIRTALPNARMEVYDTNGRLIHSQAITENVTAIDAGGWTEGVYVWKVYTTSISTNSLTLGETGKWIKE